MASLHPPRLPTTCNTTTQARDTSKNNKLDTDCGCRNVSSFYTFNTDPRMNYPSSSRVRSRSRVAASPSHPTSNPHLPSSSSVILFPRGDTERARGICTLTFRKESLRAVSPSHCCVTGDPSNAFPTTGAPSNPLVRRSALSLLLETAAAGATASRKHYRSELGVQVSK